MIVVAQCVALLLSLQSLFCFPLPARIRTFQNGDKKLSRAALSSARKRDSTSAICSTGTFDPDNVDSVDSLGTCSNQSQQALKIPSFVSKVDDLESPALPHASPFAYSSSSLLYPNPSCDVDRMSGTDLAYMGDVVYELFVRSRLVWPQQRTSDRQDRAVMLVRAEHQSRLLSRLQTQNDDFVLCTNDHLILKRGRNAASSRNHNHRKDPVVYQDSTAFEALLGYLYIASPDRFTSLLHWMDRNIDCA